MNIISMWQKEIKLPCIHLLCLFLILLLMASNGYSQISTNIIPPSTITIHSEDNQIIDATIDPPIQYLNGNVKVYHKENYMYCDSAILQGAYLKMRHNVVLIQNDTIVIFCDSLFYDGDSGLAQLFGDIRFNDGPEKTLFTSQLNYNTGTKLATALQPLQLKEDQMSLISQSGLYDVNAQKAYFYTDVYMLNDSFALISDSLAINNDTKIIEFLGPTRIKSDSSQIYCEDGYFDTVLKNGLFIKNVQYMMGSSIARGDTLQYNNNPKGFILKSKETQAYYFTNTDTIKGRYIQYDDSTSSYIVQGEGYYKNPTSSVVGPYIYFNKKSEDFKTLGRAYVSDPPMLIEADTLDYNKKLKKGKAHGNVIWKDTLASNTIYADHVYMDQKEDAMMAFNDNGRPMLLIEFDNDSMYIKADTLKTMRRVALDTLATISSNVIEKKDSVINSIEISGDTLSADTITLINKLQPSSDNILTPSQTKVDTAVFFIAHRNVKIFKSDMQAVCDSMSYHKNDSLFSLYVMPVIWSDSTQMIGDTIDLQMKNKKIEYLSLKKNATIISSPDSIFYNQIAGRIIITEFNNGNMEKINVLGDANMIYYILDEENAYIGVNTTQAGNIVFLAQENKVTDIKSYINPDSKILPIMDTNHEEIKIKNFIWRWKERPASAEDLK